MKSICAVKGVSAAGIREGKFGLALIRASGTAAGVFTSNKVRAARQVMMDRIAGRLGCRHRVSGCANAYTGEIRDAEEWRSPAPPFRYRPQQSASQHRRDRSLSNLRSSGTSASV